MAERPLAPRRGRPARPPPPALWAVATTAVALPIGGRPSQRGPAAVGRTPGSVPATLSHLTAGKEWMGLPINSTTLTAAVAALLLGLSLRRLIRWLFTEFFGSRLHTSRWWCCLAAAASPPQRAHFPKEDNEDGADRAVPLRLPRAEVRQHLEEYGVDVLKIAKRYPPLERYDLKRLEVVTSYLAGLGVDVKRAVEAYPIVLASKVEKYEAVVGLLRANGVDVKRVVEAYPRTLAGSVEKYEAVVELLRANGVDVANAVTRSPRVLGRRVETLQRTMAAIAHCGHSVAAVVRRHPGILCFTPSSVSAMLQLHSLAMPLEDGSTALPLESADPTVALFSSVGLDAGRLLKKAPGVFSLSVGYLRVAVANLERIGVDVPKVLHSAPSVLSHLPETVQRVVQFLSENGLDPVYHINKYPTLLICSVERNLRPTLTFVVEEMGRSKSELRKASVIWTCSLEGRLRPRFQYLQSLGVARFPLTSFAVYPDVRFAESLADANLAHYYAWRQANGYPVPPRWRFVSDVATSPLPEDDVNFPL